LGPIVPSMEKQHLNAVVLKHPIARVLFLCLAAQQGRLSNQIYSNTAGRVAFRQVLTVKGGRFEKTDGIALQATVY